MSSLTLLSPLSSNSTIHVRIRFDFENEYYLYSYSYNFQKTNTIRIWIRFKTTIHPNTVLDHHHQQPENFFTYPTLYPTLYPTPALRDLELDPEALRLVVL